MGGCGSTNNSELAIQKASERIAHDMREDRKDDEVVHKLLLLGAGQSGKSTIFKQLQAIYAKGFHDEERLVFLLPVHTNIIDNIKFLINASAVKGVGSPLPSQYDEEVKVIQAITKGQLTREQADLIAKFWAMPEIQKTYANRSKFQLPDNAKYFFERLDVVMSNNYVPSLEDVIMVRVRTTGIVEEKFGIDGNEFLLVDVGGQRNERKKWIHSFEHVTSVLFCVAISAYDQVLFEDSKTNRLLEALDLFKLVAEHKSFLKKPLMLFLNKSDLFQEKIQRIPISSVYPEYTGGASFEKGWKFIQGLFLKLNEKTPDRSVYTHVTCATDRTNVEAVFTAVKDIIIRNSLEEAGLLA